MHIKTYITHLQELREGIYMLLLVEIDHYLYIIILAPLLGVTNAQRQSKFVRLHELLGKIYIYVAFISAQI